ncbi:hypothetical protein AWB68_03263 [Caballeronia choica]|uniref:Uncharacterized protein n=1 Tax=Caballeronia choica TaxID=326476 RepID=A0A158J116_9BURK|nr:hypothetical protein [Caballeronia choica]SAL62193.1 hypothetical protein AWB68_03263 [Caballeronia choica]
MPEQFITFGEAARLLTVARAHVAKLVQDEILAATDGMLKESDVLEYKLKQQAAAKTFLAGQTEEYWSRDDLPADGQEPPKDR